MIACEAAGFDLVMVETVGVGQSEATVADMVDLTMLLVQPGAGDELQGIKRGVMERADIVVVNKVDGALEAPAAHAKADFETALSLHAGEGPWTPCVIACSSTEGHGLDEIADAVERHRAAMAEAGALETKRAAQAKAWLWREVEDSLMASLRADAGSRLRSRHWKRRSRRKRSHPRPPPAASSGAFWPAATEALEGGSRRHIDPTRKEVR